MVNGKEITIGTVIVLFIGIIVVLAILPEIATHQTEMTTRNNIVNETIDISTARDEGGNGINITASNFTIAQEPTGWKVTNCRPAGVLYGNATADWVSGTDYNFYPASGILQVINSTITGTESIGTNTTYIDYNYCQDGYITSGSGRSIARLIVLLSVLALLAFAVFYATKLWR